METQPSLESETIRTAADARAMEAEFWAQAEALVGVDERALSARVRSHARIMAAIRSAELRAALQNGRITPGRELELRAIEERLLPNGLSVPDDITPVVRAILTGLETELVNPLSLWAAAFVLGERASPVYERGAAFFFRVVADARRAESHAF